MHHWRSGLGFATGICGSIYAIGGSKNGNEGNQTIERLDIREGKWTLLQNMSCPRGYTSACVGNLGCLYVTGGVHYSLINDTMGVFDPRKGEWIDAYQSDHLQRNSHQMFYLWEV